MIIEEKILVSSALRLGCRCDAVNFAVLFYSISSLALVAPLLLRCPHSGACRARRCLTPWSRRCCCVVLRLVHNRLGACLVQQS